MLDNKSTAKQDVSNTSISFKKKVAPKTLFIFVVLTPSLIAYLLFTIYPNILSVYYAFLDWDGISKPLFVGFHNFSEILSDSMLWKALFHNLLLVIFVPVTIILISLILSDMLTNRLYRGSNFYKIIYFFPNVLSTVIIGIAWVFIYDGRYGLLNGILQLFGIDMKEFYWLGDERTVLFSIGVVSVWSSVGFYVVIFMNAMSGIPKSLYESAILDGITHVQRLFKITIPLIMSVLRVGIIFLMLGTIKGFDLIMTMTRGGPGGASDVIGMYMYSYIISTQGMGGNITNYGYASAIGMLVFVILIIIKLITDKFFLKDAVEY